MKVRELIRLVEQDGWYQVRTTGSHRHFYHPTKAGNRDDSRAVGKGHSRRHSKQRDEAGGVEMTEARRYAVVFDRSEDGYGAFVPDLPGCVMVGDTLEETERNIREAIAGHIEAMRAHGETIPCQRH